MTYSRVIHIHIFFKRMLKQRPNFDGDPILPTEHIYIHTIYVTLHISIY